MGEGSRSYNDFNRFQVICKNVRTCNTTLNFLAPAKFFDDSRLSMELTGQEYRWSTRLELEKQLDRLL
jgi:hypothetical protein